MIISSPSDIAFNIFGLDIYFYGIIMAAAVFTGFFIAYKLFKKYNKNAKIFFDFSPYIIIFGILGARLYYCLLNFGYYSANPLQIFNFRQGGLSIHGMLIFGIFGLYFTAKYYKINFLKLCDCFLCAVPLAQSIGRWGNFFNSEAFGRPVENAFVKLYINPDKRPFGFENFDYFHPTFLYESILDLIIFFILFGLFKKYSNNYGKITGLYLVFYGIVRLFIESIRLDSALNIFSIPVAQLVSIIMISAGAVVLTKKSKSST